MGCKHFFDSNGIMSESTEDLSKVAIPEGDDDSQKQEVGIGYDFGDFLQNEKLKKVIQFLQAKSKSQTVKIAELTKQSELKDIIISTAKENLEKIQKERDDKARELAVFDFPEISSSVGIEIEEGRELHRDV